MIVVRLLCALALVSVPLVASAQVDPVDELLRRGVELRRTGHEDEGRTAFESAYAQRREPRTAAQLGLACQAAGQWVRADALLAEAMAAPDDPWITRNRAALEGARAVGDRHLATVHLVGEVEGAAVRVNGVDAGTLPLRAPLRVLAGTLSIDVSAEGYEPLTLRFVTAAGETLRERAELRRVAPTPTPAPTPPPTQAASTPTPTPTLTPTAQPVTASAPPWRALAVGAFAGAAVLVGAGVAGLVLRNGRAEDYNARCDAGDARGECGSLRDEAATFETLAWVALPVGAALAAAGVVFVTRPTASRATALRCAPGFAGVHCALTF